MMWNHNYWFNPLGASSFPFGAALTFLLLPFLIWNLVWKGWALWRAAKNDAKVWFVVLLVVNTLGILEILYIFVFGKKRSKKR